MRIKANHLLLILSIVVCGLVFVVSATKTHAPNITSPQPASTAIQTELATNAPVQVAKTYKLVFMGDTMLARSIGREIVKGTDPYSFVAAKLQEYDHTVANIETTIAPSEVAVQAKDKQYTFNAPMQSLDLLKKYVSLAVLANNHTSDYGSNATAAMLDAFAQKGIPTVGAGKTVEAAFAANIVTLGSEASEPQVKIAFIAINDIENNYTNVAPSKPGSAYFDKQKVAASMAAAKEEGAEVVIVLTHWGIEYETTPSARQQQWGRMLIDMGADAVIGGHPHVVQPTEVYKQKPIVYSMGNFIFNGMPVNARFGNMIELPITVEQSNAMPGDGAKNTKNIVVGSTVQVPYKIDDLGFPRLQ